MPTYKEHIKFVSSKPYSKWYVIYSDEKLIGSAYLSKQDEIGLNFLDDFDNEINQRIVLNEIIKRNPRKRYLVNVNPKNKQKINFLKKNGFSIIQYTYELIST